MITTLDLSDKIRALSALSAGTISAFIAPVLPYGAICTAMVMADLISARLLARRVRHRKGLHSHATKFSSRRFGHSVMSLAKIYALLLLSHGVDCVIVGDSVPFSILRFSAGLVCFWQFWSILENEASANNSSWARIAQHILVDKTQRHLGIDLSELTDPEKDNRQ